MSSPVLNSRIFASMFSTAEMREVFSGRAWAQKWLDTEAALAKAQGELGVIPKEKADIINEWCGCCRNLSQPTPNRPAH